MAGAAITTASVKVGLDASKFKAGVDGLKGYMSDITSTATKMIGLLGIGYLGLQGTIEGVKASFGKVMAFEKQQAAIEAVAGGAEKAKNLVATLSEITGRNEEQGTALANMARKFINIGMSADEANALVKSFYKAAKAGPDEVTETYAKLENLAIQIEERGVAPIKAWINISKAGIPIFDVMADVLTENMNKTKEAQAGLQQLEGNAGKAAKGMVNQMAMAADGVKAIPNGAAEAANAINGHAVDINKAMKAIPNGAAEAAKGMAKNVVTSKEAVKMLEGGAIDASVALKTLSKLGSDPRTQAAVTAMGGTMAGAMKKAKEEISLYFYEIGKFLNYITGGTKTYVTLFKGITSVVHWMREQIAALPDFLQTRMNFIPNFINGMKFLWNSFVTGIKVTLSSSAEGWIMIWKAFNDTVGISSDKFSSLGESTKALGFIFKGITESFGLDLSKVSSLWEGIYETFLLFKEAAQLGFLAIGQIGVKAMNELLNLTEQLLKKYDKLTDKIAMALGKGANKLGLVDDQTLKFLAEDNKRRQNAAQPNLGRFDETSIEQARQDMLNQFKSEREKRLEESKKKAEERKKKQEEEEQKFQRDSVARGGMGNQITAPSLLTRGGADEYKLLVERQQGSLVDLAKQQIDETAKTNQILENVRDGMVDNATAIRQLQPAAPILGLIPQG